MPDNTFDVVSKIEMPEVQNAIQQAQKEIHQRYDLKDSQSNIELKEKDNKILLASADEFKLRAVIDILQSKLVKRGVPLKGLTYGEIIPAAGSTVRQEVTLQQGIPIEKAREIVKKIKDSKLKVQASIQGDFVRVAGKDRDDAAIRDQAAARRAISASTCSSSTTAPTEAWPRRIESHDIAGPAGTSRSAARRAGGRRAAAAPRWSAIRIRSTAAPCTTRWCTGSRGDCGGRASWCCGSISAASARSEGEHAQLESARSKMRGRRSTGCASAIPSCRSRWPAFRSARG